MHLKNNKINTGLVLTGGGAKAAYQVGVIQALAEIVPANAQGHSPFSVISGTSAGAINAAYLASRADNWTEGTLGLKALWDRLTLKQVYRTDSISLTRIAAGWIYRLFFGVSNSKHTRSNYLLDTKPLQALLNREVDFNRMRENIRSEILSGIAFSTAQYFSGTTVSFFDGNPNIKPWKAANRIGLRTQLETKHVMASSAIPVFFPPIRMGENFYGDGSIRQTTPLSPVIHLGADRIISVGIRHLKKPELALANPHPPTCPPSLAQITGELLNSVFMDSLDSDIERVEHINESLQALEKIHYENKLRPLREIPILHLRPSRDLQSVTPSTTQHFPPMLKFLLRGLGVSLEQGNDLIGYLAFFPECIKPLMELGYADTIARRTEIEAFLKA